MFDLLRECRQSVRALARRPALAIAALLTLALGVGANGAVFSALNSIVLRPLPYAAPERLVTIWPNHFVAHREIDFMRRNLRSLSVVASLSPGWLMPLTGLSEPAELDGAGVSANLFSTLGVRPLMGRTFGTDADLPGGPQEIVLSHQLWQTVFGGDPTVVGRAITLSGSSWQVIGVMPRTFHIMDAESDFWFPLRMDPQAQHWAGATSFAFGRLGPGATIAQANGEFKALAVRMAAQFNQPPESAADAGVIGLKQQIIGPVRTMLLVLFGAVLFILAIAAANMMNLLLVRASERRTEFAVRTSLGARRRDLVRQLGLESLLLAATGGTLGLALAWVGVRGLRGMLPPETPRLLELDVDWRVVLFCALAALLVGALAGLVPVLLTSSRSVAQFLRSGRTVTAGTNRTRAALIVSEVALAVVLVSGATLMLRTIARLHQVDPGFRTSHVLTMRVQPTARGSAALRAYWRAVLPRLAALPDVQAAGTVLHLPMSGRKWNTNIEREGVTLAPGATPPRSAWQTVGGDYFGAMGITLLQGRTFTDADREDAARVVMVNDELAGQLWPGRSALGQRIRAGRVTAQEWATVIGVVRGVRHDSLSVSAGPELYTPFAQNTVYSTSVALRTSGDPRALVSAVRNAIWSVSRNVPISNLRAIDEVLSESITRRRVVLTLLGGFAAVGVLLGLVGIYGLVAHTVRQRTRELGIRMALGAAPRAVLQLMVKVGLQWAALGVLLGSISAYALTGFMQSLIFGIAPHDPLSLAAAPLLVLSVAALAALLPARRAAALNPARVLQE